MSRKKIVAGNWKMNLDLTEVNSLVDALMTSNLNSNVETIVIPPYPFIYLVSEKLKGTNIKVGAQNCYTKVSGAYTGEVSAKMLTSVGAKYVLVGHSERREYFKENNNELLQKIELALQNELTPIYCIGEKLMERKSENHFKVIAEQLNNVAFHLSEQDFSKLIIAYEPVWAIGTGETASPEQAQEIHAFIRNLISTKYNSTIADNCSILYGGSCNPSNAKELFSCADVDGGLIGGASLKAGDFESIISSF